MSNGLAEQNRQLVLSLDLQEQSLFSNYVPGVNGLLLDQLQLFSRQASEAMLYLWGGEACGKTHLLHATCHAAHDAGVRSVYIDLARHVGGSLAVLDGIENVELLALDNLDAIAHGGGASEFTQKIWQETLYELFYAIRLQGGRILVAANASPLGLDIGLPDLRTRLGWGPSWHVQPLTDEDRRSFLRQRAMHKGMHLEDDALQWILQHQGRDASTLNQAIELLASCSMQQQKKPTLTFVRSALGALSAPAETTPDLQTS